MGQKDIKSKSILRFPDVFADVVNGKLFDGKQEVKPSELTPIDTSLVTTDSDTDKAYERLSDVSMLWQNTVINIIRYNFENQIDYDSYMPMRLFAKTGIIYNRQLAEHDAYRRREHNENIAKPLPFFPVINLIIYWGKCNWKATKLSDSLKLGKKVKALSGFCDFEVPILNISKMTKEEISRYKSDFAAIADFVNGNVSAFDKFKNLNHTEETISLLSTLTNNENLKDLLNKYRAKKAAGGIVDMTTILDVQYKKKFDEGISVGRNEGISIGRNEGISIGRNEGISIGRNEGISIGEVTGSIRMCKELGKSKDETRKLMFSKFSPTSLDIDLYMDKIWNEQ